MSADKLKRVQGAFGEAPRDVTYVPIDLTKEPISAKLRSCGAFEEDALSFYSLLGVSYYLSKANFIALTNDIAGVTHCGGAIVFDYPDELTYTERAGERAKKQAMLARARGRLCSRAIRSAKWRKYWLIRVSRFPSTCRRTK